MRLVGIDGGGTKTDAVLCDETGRVLKRVKGGPSSPTSLTFNQAIQNLAKVLNCLLAEQEGLNTKISAMFAGVSGGSVGNNKQLMGEALRSLLPGCALLFNDSDAVNALRCAIPQGDALVAIAGTGSSVFACVGEEMRQVGGWGYLLGDEGSGYDLGRRALICALKDMDGRSEKTSLTKACAEKLGKSPTMAVPDLYAGGRARIADFAVVLLGEARKGDPAAIREMKEAAQGLCLSIRTAGRHLTLSEKPVALAGSVWKDALYTSCVAENLGGLYRLCASELPPVYGSLVVAAGKIGIRADAEFERVFRESLAQTAQANIA